MEHSDTTKLVNAWTSPTALLVVLGGIVWGVQLNFSVQALTQTVGGLQVKIEAEERRLDRLSENSLRMGIILEQLEEKFNMEEKYAEEEEKGKG